MLNIMQRDIIRTGYRAAAKTGDDTVIRSRVRQLAKDFDVSEEEILKIVSGTSGSAPVASPPVASMPAVSPAAAPHKKRRGGFSLWTSEQLRQLKTLSAQGKGPTEIAGIMGLDVKRVGAKLYNMKRAGALSRPAAELVRAGAAPASVPENEAPASKTRAPAERAEKGIPAAEPAPAPGPRDLLKALQENSRPTEELPTPAVGPAPPSEDDLPVKDPEYAAALAKLAEPEAPGINLARELLDQMDHFTAAYAAKPGRLQADESAGWATGSFDAGGSRYSISLRRREIS